MEKLATKIVEKPWGRRGIDPRFGVDPEMQVGEIWFEPPAERELDVMAKYLFTTERLSIQVHPDDSTARQRGSPRGLGLRGLVQVEPHELLLTGLLVG